MTNVNQTATIPSWVKKKIIDFFNSAGNVRMILDGTIIDDPKDTRGNALGPALAARILRERKALPNGVFSDFDQIENIKGVGEATIVDLVYSLSLTAAEDFRTSMYNTSTIYEANWPLEYFRFPFEDKSAFETVADNPDELIQFVVDKVNEMCSEREVDAENTEKMLADLRNSGLDEDEFEQWLPTGACELAKWFYEFDADNWFTWEEIHKQTNYYFIRKANQYSVMMQLHFLNFENRGILNPGISPNRLPVVVNRPEQCITFWISELYD